MMLEQQIESAKRRLAAREYKGTVRFRGLTLEHFSEEELCKLVEYSMEQAVDERRSCESERHFYQAAIDRFRAVNAGYRAEVAGRHSE